MDCTFNVIFVSAAHSPGEIHCVSSAFISFPFNQRWTAGFFCDQGRHATISFERIYSGGCKCRDCHDFATGSTINKHEPAGRLSQLLLENRRIPRPRRLGCKRLTRAGNDQHVNTSGFSHENPRKWGYFLNTAIESWDVSWYCRTGPRVEPPQYRVIPCSRGVQRRW